MAWMKEACVCITVIALIVQIYIRLKMVPSVRSSVDYNKRHVSGISIVTNISHVEGRHHSLENINVTFRTHKPFLPKDILIGTKSKELLPKMSKEGQCHYKVQVYDKYDKLAKKKFVLRNIVKQSKGSALIQTDIQCDNNCDIELTIAGDKNKFTRMDAVVFHFMKLLIPKPHPPVSMNPNQTWVYFSWESPRSNAGESVDTARLPVHATWTYHRGSEIVTPYGYYRPGVPMTNTTKSPAEWVKGKTKLIAWMASNCIGTYWPRFDFVKELKKHIPIDIYGACGPLKCTPNWSTKCTMDLMRQYKFYLSLENAECGDYITEKLWEKPLIQGVVPIVYGPNRKVYEDLAPPNSFIYVGDYKNMEELANYLKLLDSNHELYAQYLEWQYKGNIGLPKPMHESYDPSIFCNLIPVIEKVKRGELQRTPVRESAFFKSCRKSNKGKGRSLSTYGVGNWDPW